jgi:hypothetical protein
MARRTLSLKCYKTDYACLCEYVLYVYVHTHVRMYVRTRERMYAHTM